MFLRCLTLLIGIEVLASLLRNTLIFVGTLIFHKQVQFLSSCCWFEWRQGIYRGPGLLYLVASLPPASIDPKLQHTASIDSKAKSYKQKKIKALPQLSLWVASIHEALHNPIGSSASVCHFMFYLFLVCFFFNIPRVSIILQSPQTIFVSISGISNTHLRSSRLCHHHVGE
jgi:hypothetical protein